MIYIRQRGCDKKVLDGPSNDQPAPLGVECTKFGEFELDPFITLDLVAVDNFPPQDTIPAISSFTYSGSESLPLIVDGKKIDLFEIEAKCLFTTNNVEDVPFCSFTVSLYFCDGTFPFYQCNTSEDPSYRSGSFLAFGTGPEPYFVDPSIGGATGDYVNADGLFDSEFDFETFLLSIIVIDICYDGP